MNVLLSINPKNAEKIFQHTKMIELRRVRPKLLKHGNLVLIYVSSPVKALIGGFKVDEIIEEPLEQLWLLVKNKAGVTRQEFESYYSGISVGVGICFKPQDVWQLPTPVVPAFLRKHNISVPQGFRYLAYSELALFRIPANMCRIPANILGDVE